MQLQLWDNNKISRISFEDLLQAYFQCRSNKRNTANALKFELVYEQNLLQLLDEINTGKYMPGRSIAFIIDKPVKREIFAADFRDRIVHHLIIQKLNPIFEQKFIYDSYSCRKGKGTHFGINRVDRFIRRCSSNYRKDCYVLKLDIKGFFMHINRKILYKKLHRFILDNYHHSDKAKILELTNKIVFNDPKENCIIKGGKDRWKDLPESKSLFHSKDNCGLPIGNLTSQVFANFYMDSFDHFVKHDLKIKYYGRYVDDFVIVYQDKEYLKSLVPLLSNFLLSTLKLTIHPKKIYLQHYSKGVKFIGGVIKPHRIYIANRTKGNLYASIDKHNEIARDHKPTKEEKQAFMSSMNSYLGIMKHYKTYNIRKTMLKENISGWWENYFTIGNRYEKLEKKQKILKQ